jgi:hypothetical protein
MPTATYTPLANLTLSANAASVTFSSISQSSRDLVLIINSSQATAADFQIIRPNNDTAQNYYIVSAEANGTTTSSVANSTTTSFSSQLNYNNASTTENNIQIWNFFDYATTTQQKIALCKAGLFNSSTSYGIGSTTNRWANTSAITSIKILNASASNFAAGSTFSLYGVLS